MFPRFRPIQHPETGTRYRCPLPFPATTVSTKAMGAAALAAAEAAGRFLSSWLAGMGSLATDALVGGAAAGAGRDFDGDLGEGPSLRATRTGGLGRA